jgi:hypothetical protein
MAAGLPSYLVEIEFTAGVWTAVTADARQVHIKQGRDTTVSDWAPASCTVEIWNPADATTNQVQHYTPDNPLSSYYPNVVPGKRVRVTVTGHSIAAADQRRFSGYIDSWSYDPGTGISDATVTIEASDGLAQLATRTLMTDVIEQSRSDGVTFGLTIDAYPFDDRETSRTARNLGCVAGDLDAPHGPGRVYKPSTGGGSMRFLPPEESLLTDGILEVRATDAKISPVLMLQRRPEELWLSIQCWFRTTQKLASGFSTILAGYDSEDQLYWRVVLRTSGGNVQLEVDNSAGTSVLQLNNANQPYASPSVANGSWWFFELWSSTGTDMNSQFGNDIANAAAGAATGIAISNTVSVAVGGQMNPKSLGKPANCSSVDLAGLILNQAIAYNRHHWAIPLDTSFQASTAASRWLDLAYYAANESPFLIADSADGDGSQKVARMGIRGSSIGEQMARLARTVGGVAYWSHNLERMYFRTGASCRPVTPVVTVTLGADDDGVGGASMEWVTDVASAPTRYTATSPAGNKTKIDSTRELLGQRREGSTIDTVAITDDDAGTVAAFALRQSTRLRLGKLRVNLPSAANDLYAAMLSLYPTARVRLTGIPVGMVGFSYVDGYVLGWTETYTHEAAVWELDLSPADPPEARVDDDEYGRVSGSGSVLNGALTSSGTTVAITPPAGTTWSTTAGDYPCDVLVHGERITLPSAPASGSAPSWTGCTRGVAPTAAAAHATSSAVDLWHAATVPI